MGKNSKENIDNRVNKIKNKKFLDWKERVSIIFLTILMIAIVFIVAACVKVNEIVDNPISLDNWLLYYGTIGGALISGLITAVGLFMTFKINANQLKEQREIDNNRWENSDKQFNQQIKIQIINEKINDYKIYNYEMNKLMHHAKELNIQLFKYKSDLLQFRLDIDMIFKLNHNRKIVPFEFKRQFSVIVDEYTNFKDQSHKVNVIAECVYGEHIYAEFKKTIDMVCNMETLYRELLKFRHINEVADNYNDYIDGNNKSYDELMNRFDEFKTKIDECRTEISNITDILSVCVYEIPNLVGKLYKDKYSLDSIKIMSKS